MTASRSVEALYDALFALESPRRGPRAYPIHKRLRLDHDVAPDIDGVDIYDWIAERIDLQGTDRVLDAGCGVGFGSIRLAERGAAHVTGVTLSERELTRGRSAVAASSVSARVELRRASFDDVPEGAFDVVVAVESLKHSTDLRVTLEALVRSLAPGGRLLIVEDVLVGDAGSPSALRLTADWSLTKLYGEADYVEGLGEHGYRVVDLTAVVPLGNRVLLACKLAILGFVLALAGRERAAGLRAFRGGLHLERLYAAGAMRYMALLYRKNEAESARCASTSF
jgi:SAM-dependent methyltransferase